MPPVWQNDRVARPIARTCHLLWRFATGAAGVCQPRTTVNTMSQRYRLVVLFGGESAEHDVSCVTARHVLAAVDQERFAVEAIGISRSGTWHNTGAGSALMAGRLDELPASLPTTGVETDPLTAVAPSDLPVVVLPLLHGPMGEDGTVQGMLDLAGVPYAGSGVLGSSLCMDKTMAKQAAASYGIAQARWISLHADDVSDTTASELMAELGDTLFVKPANMGSSVGVSRTTSTHELTAALRIAASYDEWLVVEESVHAREIEVGVLGRSPSLSVPRWRIAPSPRTGPSRLLLRRTRSRLPAQRGEHDARIHTDLDVPQALGCNRRGLSGTDQPTDRFGDRTPCKAA